MIRAKRSGMAGFREILWHMFVLGSMGAASILPCRAQQCTPLRDLPCIAGWERLDYRIKNCLRDRYKFNYGAVIHEIGPADPRVVQYVQACVAAVQEQDAQTAKLRQDQAEQERQREIARQQEQDRILRAQTPEQAEATCLDYVQRKLDKMRFYQAQQMPSDWSAATRQYALQSYRDDLERVYQDARRNAKTLPISVTKCGRYLLRSFGRANCRKSRRC
jgi:hypothetical protein